MSRKPRPLQDNDVYKALGSLGRIDKSLAPRGIEKYEALLNCPEVERHVSPSATKRQRAETARNAIIKAVSGISEKDQKKVAEVALCTDKKYVGKSVGE